MTQNAMSFILNALPQIESGKPVPSIFDEELKRVENEAERIKSQININETLGGERNKQVQEYSRIQTDYTAWKQATSAQEKLREVKDSLKPFRPPTAPSSDLEQERKQISELAKRNLFFVQMALLLVVLAGVCYLVLDKDTANLIALAVLLVGIAVGFFLRR